MAFCFPNLLVSYFFTPRGGAEPNRSNDDDDRKRSYLRLFMCCSGEKACSHVVLGRARVYMSWGE